MSATEYIHEYEKLKSEREVYRSHWQDVSRLTLPSRDFYQEWTPGNKRNRRIFDTTAMYANEQLAGALHSLLTSPSQKWFTLGADDPTLNLTLASLQWLEIVSERMYSVFNAPDGMFNSQAHEMYLELCAYGTAVFYEDYRKGRVRFRSFPLSKCYGVENEEGVIDTVYRHCETTAISAMAFFKELASEHIRKTAEKTPYEKVEFLHVVKPRNGYTKKGGTRTEKPYKSCYLCVKSKAVMDEGGYNVFPYQFVRFSKRSGETYGFGPGMAAYPDTRMLNRIMEVTIRGMEKIVDPPLLMPNDSVIGPLIINPGGIINYDPTFDPVTPLNVNGRPEVAYEALRAVRERVLKHFYVDWIGINSEEKSEYMKATVSVDRQQKGLQQLGPLLSRLNSEFTGPLIDRVFDLMIENDLLPPPPADLAGVKLKVDYVSPIAQAQKASDLESIIRSLQLASQAAGVQPDIMDNFDLDEITRYSSLNINYIPPRLMRSAEQVQMIRQKRAEDQQVAQDAALQEQNSKSIKNAAGAARLIQQAGSGV